jgi:hypothetical protein
MFDDDHGVHITKQPTPKKTDVVVSLFVIKKKKRSSCSTNQLGAPLCPIGLSTAGINKKLHIYMTQQLTYSRVDLVNK